jgi:hypothetical protein
MKMFILALLIIHCFPIRKLVGISLLSTLLITNCYSQWVRVNNGMGVYKNITSLTANENYIFAGTMTGTGVYHSSDDGNNWTQTGLSVFGGTHVWSLAISGVNLFAGTDIGVFISTNNGTNWTQTSLTGKAVYSLAINGNYIFAGIYNSTNPRGIYLSTNNGLNWVQTSMNTQSVFSLVNNGNNIFAGTWGSGVYISTNNGTNWDQTALNNQYIYSLAISENSIFVGTRDSGVFFSSNSGMNWSQTTFNNHSVKSMVFSGNNIFAGSLNYPAPFGGVRLSTNYGVNWIVKNEGFYVNLSVYALLIKNNYIFAGTEGRCVYRRPLSELVDIQNISTEIPTGFSLSQNYPNPFNSQTKITFEIQNETQDIASLRIFDITGREVATLVNEQLATGTYSVDFDGTNFPSGIYLYRLTAGDYKETKRMVLVK